MYCHARNIFAVNDNLFRQTNGLAMGSPCSGTVANLAMARRERSVIRRAGILTYTRYIDDIFMLIEARKVSEVRHILREVSEAVAPLQIQWKVSKKHAVYLDAQVTANSFAYRGFTHSLYKKPDLQHAYLPWSSAHPTHVKRGLVIGEATRLALLSSEEASFKSEIARFKDQLLRRGYPDKAVIAWTRRVPWNRRFVLLQKARTLEDSTPDILRIPTTYNPLWENINLDKVFDAVTTEWRNVWESDTRPRKLSLSQKRGESIMDLLSAWNKRTYGEDEADE